MLALTFVDIPCPTPIGLKSWWTFFGMIATPAAIRARRLSGSVPSTAATYRISSVIRPRLACSIWVMEVAPHTGCGGTAPANRRILASQWAVAVARSSRMTVTLIFPGYSMRVWIFFARSDARRAS